MIALRTEPNSQFPGRLSVCSFSPSHSAKVVPWGLAAGALLRAQPQVASRELSDLVSTKRFRSAQFVTHQIFFFFFSISIMKSCRQYPVEALHLSCPVILLELKTGKTTDCSFHTSPFFFPAIFNLPACSLSSNKACLLVVLKHAVRRTKWIQNKMSTVSVKQACQLLTLAWSDIFFW